MTEVLPRTFNDYVRIYYFRAEIRSALYFIFSKGFPKPCDMTVKNYLIKQKGFSKDILKKSFSKSIIEKMEVDSDGETFNISRLYDYIEMVLTFVADNEHPITTSPLRSFKSALFSLKQSHRTLLLAVLSKRAREEVMSLEKDLKEKIEILINIAKEKFNIKNAYIQETTENSAYNQGRQHLGGITSLLIEYLHLAKNKYMTCLRGARSFGDFCKDVDKMLEFVFWETLVCFSQDSVGLTQESRKNLKAACHDYELPIEEMFQAFLPGEESLTGGPVHGNFYPVECQEFYAAIAIMNELNHVDKEIVTSCIKSLPLQSIPMMKRLEIKDSLSKFVSEMLKRKPQGVEDILKKLPCNGASLNLAKYQNVLVYLTGLLKANSRLDEATAKELVGLLQTALTVDSELWLHVIIESEYDQNILAEVGKIIPKHQLCARDGTMAAALSLLKNHEDFKKLELYIESNDPNLQEFKEMQGIISARQTPLQFIFIHHWKYPDLGCSDEYLESSEGHPGKEGGRLIKFVGSLMKLSLVGKNVKWLQLAIGRKFANNLDRDIEYLKDISQVERLGMHVVGGLPLDYIPHLPKNMPLDLWFSDTSDSDVEWTGNAIRKLLNTNSSSQITSVRFPRSMFTVDGCLKLAAQLKGIEIGESGILVSSTNLSKNDAETVEKAYSQKLNIKFSLLDEIKIWDF